jgi:hypothetical protein
MVGNGDPDSGEDLLIMKESDVMGVLTGVTAAKQAA